MTLDLARLRIFVDRAKIDKSVEMWVDEVIALIDRLEAAERVLNACHAVAPGVALARSLPDPALLDAWRALVKP